MTLKLQFTSKGLDACLSAKDQGLKAKITHMAFGADAYVPSKDQTGLSQQKEKVEIADYQDAVGDVRMACVFDGALEYPIREIGLFLEDGTLLGVYSEPNKTLGYRTPAVKVVQWITLNITALPSDSVTIVVGTENLNLILDKEFISSAQSLLRTNAAIIKNAHWNLQLSEQIRHHHQGAN